MNHADMLLRGAQIAWVFERDPGVAGFKEHGQHLAPQISRAQPSKHLDLSALCFFLISDIAIGEGFAVKIMQIRNLVRREQRPGSIDLDTFHEKIRGPICRIHVMRAAAIVSRVFSQLEELFNIDMPGLKVSTNRTLSLTALIYGNGRIIGYFQERHDTLRDAVSAANMSAQAANGCPVVAQSARIFRKQRVIPDRLEDTVEVVRYGRQKA